jgi:hypothetical protein
MAFYCLRFETTPTWRARTPYLYPPGTGWPGCIPGHWILFSSHEWRLITCPTFIIPGRTEYRTLPWTVYVIRCSSVAAWTCVNSVATNPLLSEPLSSNKLFRLITHLTTKIRSQLLHVSFFAFRERTWIYRRECKSERTTRAVRRTCLSALRSQSLQQSKAPRFISIAFLPLGLARQQTSPRVHLMSITKPVGRFGNLFLIRRVLYTVKYWRPKW